MKEYFIEKLTEIVRRIEVAKSNIITEANKLDIKALEYRTTELSLLKQRHEEFSTDAVIYLSVNDFIEIYNLKLIDDYKAGYAFQYTRKPITIEERARLASLYYKFKEAKV